MKTLVFASLLVMTAATVARAEPGLCARLGSSGHAAHVVSCVDKSPTERTLTCAKGYFATRPDIASITLTGDQAFAGCTQIDRCVTAGFSGHPESTKSCVAGIDTRTIACNPGFEPASITLDGNAPFAGCKPTTAVAVVKPTTVDRTKVLSVNGDKCQNPGYSGKRGGALACKPIDGGRIITCIAGFYPMPDGRAATAAEMASASITIMGDAPFAGCKVASMCALHGYNGSTQHTLGCTDGLNERTIKCAPGYFPVAADKATQAKGNSLTLVGAAKFSGCVATPG